MWSVAQVKPNQIGIAAVNLQRQGFTTFYPTFAATKLRRNKWTVIQEPLFIGYVFIELLPDQRWAAISTTYGVCRLLTRPLQVSEYNEPCPIPAGFINGLRRCCSYCDDKAPWRLDHGTRVRLERGPFAKFEGVITAWSGADRVKLVIWLLNRDVHAEVLDADIAAVE
jgi:transcriptional antiterminator RfaH